MEMCERQLIQNHMSEHPLFSQIVSSMHTSQFSTTSLIPSYWIILCSLSSYLHCTHPIFTLLRLPTLLNLPPHQDSGDNKSPVSQRVSHIVILLSVGLRQVHPSVRVPHSNLQRQTGLQIYLNTVPFVSDDAYIRVMAVRLTNEAVYRYSFWYSNLSCIIVYHQCVLHISPMEETDWLFLLHHLYTAWLSLRIWKGSTNCSETLHINLFFMIHWTDKWKSVRLKDLTLVAHFPASAPFSILHNTISFCLVLLWWLWAKCQILYFMYSENENDKVVGSKRCICWANQHHCCVQFVWLEGIENIFHKKCRSLDWHWHLFSFAFHSSTLISLTTELKVLPSNFLAV